MLYFALPHRFRWILLLVSSYYFYMCWNPFYVVLIFMTTAIAYWTGIRMGRTENQKHRKVYLTLGLVASLGILFTFKYLNFSFEVIRDTLNILNLSFDTPVLRLLLPVGISFYTFQTLSYTIDVYRGKKSVETHFGIFAVYVAFFPQLVAGPIERSTNLLPQFYEYHPFDYQRVTDGLKLILWGFFKKLVIADRLAVYVNQVYSAPGDYTAWPIILATYFFTFQIYCDFSAYSDIAIGSAQVMGFKLMDNFRRPYFSKSIAEFWRRWHISLSTWFKDYLYIPLGGNRCSRTRWLTNIFMVFLISGLWHGAAWPFVIWGTIHGLYLITGILTSPARKSLTRKIGLDNHPTLLKCSQVIITFHLVVFAWIFFRAESFSDAMHIISNIGRVDLKILFQPAELFKELYGVALGRAGLMIALFAILFMEGIHLLQRHWQMRHMLSEKPLWLRWSVYYSMIFGIIMFGVYSSEEFIYFQF